MKVSVIIPTYNGKERILHVLKSIERQTYQPSEVIVVIDGSVDGTGDLLRNSVVNISKLRIIEQENQGRARVRNNGADKASGELLVFIDDDMIASQGWLDAHVSHHSRYPGTIATGVEEDNEERYKHDFHDFIAWKHKEWNNIEFVEGYGNRYSKRPKNPYLTASNLSIPRNIFLQLGGFDGRLSDAEDYDLAVRALEQNIVVYYLLNAVAFNNTVNLPSCYDVIRRQRQYRLANSNLRQLKPDLYNKFPLRDGYKPSFAKRLIYKLFCGVWWIKSVDNEYWILLPRKVRFKFYDIIVTANGCLC